MPFALDVLSLVLGFVFGAGIVLLLRSGGIGQAEAGRLAAELNSRFARTTIYGPRLSSGSESWRLSAPNWGTRRRRRPSFRTWLEQERLLSAEKIALLERAEAKLGDAFKALSSEALRSNNQSFLDLARTTLERFQENARGDLEQRQSAISDLVAPVRQSLDRMDSQIQSLEKERVGAYEGLKQQVISLLDSQRELRSETSNLVRALRSPVARGRWGEIQLKRVVEMAGMVDHCDFFEQHSVTDDQGNKLRPDMVVKLPGGKTIVVDAKAPVEAYLDGIGSTDDAARRTSLVRHARHVRDHMKQLGGKAYWDQFSASPDSSCCSCRGRTSSAPHWSTIPA